MIVNLDELRKEYLKEAEDYRMIEKYEADKEEEYKYKAINTDKEIRKYLHDDDLYSSYMFYKQLERHHQVLKMDARIKAEEYEYKAENIEDEDIFPF